jgi:hypothetical protein
MEFKASTVTDWTVQTVNVKADIVDAEPRPAPYRRDGRRWQPRAIAITWERRRSGDGEWSQWRPVFSGGRVTGPHLRKDGSDALVDTTVKYLKDDDPEFGEWIAASKPGTPTDKEN